jgi:hypothetical protein
VRSPNEKHSAISGPGLYIQKPSDLIEEKYKLEDMQYSHFTLLRRSTRGVRQSALSLTTTRFSFARCSRNHLAMQRHQVSPHTHLPKNDASIDNLVIRHRHPPAPLRSSERRKLRTRTAERFQLAPEIADNLVPDGLLSQKFSAYNGEPGVSVRSITRTRLLDPFTVNCRSSISRGAAIRSGLALGTVGRVQMS